MKLERTQAGLLELHLSDDPGQFECLAERIRAIMKGRWVEQLNGLDQSYWELEAHGKVLTVHREHYLGVSVFCEDGQEMMNLLAQLASEFSV